MTVGKAGAHPPDQASTVGFSFIAPCFTTIDERTIKDHIERNHFFWLDLTSPTEQDIDQLGEVFGFHPLALEDTLHFGQRPKLDNYRRCVAAQRGADVRLGEVSGDSAP
jgi:Mg2+ and Co2+ transporters